MMLVPCITYFACLVTFVNDDRANYMHYSTYCVGQVRVDPHSVYQCASTNVVQIIKSIAYIVITDPGIHLATTKTVYLLIGQLVVYVTDVFIVEIVKE